MTFFKKNTARRNWGYEYACSHGLSSNISELSVRKQCSLLNVNRNLLYDLPFLYPERPERMLDDAING